MAEDDNKQEVEVTDDPVIIEKLLPPIYSRELKLFGVVIWSDTRQLDEEAFYERITSRINGDIAKELLILKSRNQ